MRSQKPLIRPVHNQILNETTQPSTNAGDITSYIGRTLTINHHQVIVEDILGQGGFAFVFLVRSLNQQRYALKRMYVNNQHDLHVCQREISIIKEFSSHPNIVKYIDSSVHRISSPNIQKRYYYSTNDQNDNKDDDSIYEILLLTEYCLNGSLIKRLNEQRSVGSILNERQILRIFADICNAVSACHFRRPEPILHRDIKLENILIDSRQNYVLCDFGSAIMLPSSTTNDYQQYQTNHLTTNLIQQLEEEIQRYTTLSYRAPEMIDLYSRLPITLKVDIWAMGCLLYKLMYNTMPFGDSILAIQNGTFVIPDDMVQVYSKELNILVRYILEVQINKRPDIWQVSYLTYKLLGIDCPISNRCQSKVPDLSTIQMPLTESESRHQRTTTLSKAKSTSANVLDESLSHGTAVNPRERPRGLNAPSAPLISFNQSSSTAALQPHPSTNPSRSGSAAQLMFDDDFSQMASNTISLTNISTVTTTAKNEQNVFRARPSPPTTVSATTGLVSQQQFFPPPPTSSMNIHGHRRSSSQTLPSTNIQAPFQSASSVDSSHQDQLNCDIEQTYLSESDDDQSKSPKNSKINEKTINHHQSTEEADKTNLFSYLNSKKSGKSLIDNSSTRQTASNEYFDNDDEDGFNPLVNEDSDSDNERNQKTPTLNYESNYKNKTFSTDENNPFLRAPFHHSSATKQTTIPLSNDLNQISTFNPINIVTGTRTSAFVPYQKPNTNSENYVFNKTNNSEETTVRKSSYSESLPSNVFTNAPFKTKSTHKQRSTTNKIDYISTNFHLIDINLNDQENKTKLENK